jgi:predicted ArsR family transcriptional regulator
MGFTQETATFWLPEEKSRPPTVDLFSAFRNNSVVEIDFAPAPRAAGSRSRAAGIPASASEEQHSVARVQSPVRTERMRRDSVTPAQRRVVQSLLVDGPACAVDLAERLEITPAGVRRHIDALESDGYLVGGDRPAYGRVPSRGRGRPPKIYSLTESGRDAFDQAYDDLAVSALNFMLAKSGPDVVAEFSQGRAEDFERRYRPALAAAGDDESARLQALAEVMTDDGFAATVLETETGVGLQICQHNCPVAHVAEQFPVLCEKETDAIARLLGTNVTRLATIANGDGVCTAMVTKQKTEQEMSAR